VATLNDPNATMLRIGKEGRRNYKRYWLCTFAHASLLCNQSCIEQLNTLLNLLRLRTHMAQSKMQRRATLSFVKLSH
jgi:hypothetical protein